VNGQGIQDVLNVQYLHFVVVIVTN